MLTALRHPTERRGSVSTNLMPENRRLEALLEAVKGGPLEWS